MLATKSNSTLTSVGCRLPNPTPRLHLPDAGYQFQLHAYICRMLATKSNSMLTSAGCRLPKIFSQLTYWFHSASLSQHLFCRIFLAGPRKNIFTWDYSLFDLGGFIE